jgi:hypothetical protein
VLTKFSSRGVMEGGAMCLFGPGCTAISVVVLAIVDRVCGMGRQGIEVSAKLRSRYGGARPVGQLKCA